ncbi:MAG TPA: phage antirepressor KilAC domain-containing protein, partial [Cellulomonas sp.]
MTHLTIAQPRTATPFDGIKRTDERGDYWSARDLQPHLGYDQWRRFEDSIERARVSIENSGLSAEDHVAGAGNMVEIGSGATRIVSDYRLTRYGAYIVAMNGDPRKPEVAAAQTYFAVRTHEAEVADERALPHDLPTALRAYADEVEARQALEAKVARDAPKVGYVDRYVADGDLLRFRTVAARVGVQEHALRELLIARKWIYVETSTRWSN